MPRLNIELSKVIAEEIQAPPLRSFENAFYALDYLPDEAKYIEGWMVDVFGGLRGCGWCEVNGQVIDPTFYDIGQKYVLGVRYLKENAKILKSYYRTFPLIWYDVDATNHREYLRALDHALRIVSGGQFDHARVIPESVVEES